MTLETVTVMNPPSFPSIWDALETLSVEASTLSVCEVQEVLVVTVVTVVMGVSATAQNLVRHVVHLEVRNQQL